MARSTDALLSALLAGVERELPRAVELRHRLHAQPEPANAEQRTAAIVAEQLPVGSLTVAGTGRMARIGASQGAAIAVRAELDGLPIEECTDSAQRATNGLMHACGHDAHMAALVALSHAAHALGDALPHPLLALFQPSEEAYPSGAERLTGELLATPPAAFLAAHIHPELPWGTVALDPGVVNASCDNFEITVVGEPSHGAYPHRGRDPVLALAQIVLALHAQLGRRVDPLAAAVLSIGVLEAGVAENVLPSHARARGSLRAHSPLDRIALSRMAEEVVTGIAAAHSCRATVTVVPGEPALVNDPSIVTRAREMLSRARLAPAPEWRSCGSDDFAFYSTLAPLAMAFVGLAGAPGFAQRPLHHPELLPPDDAVGAVARVQAVLYSAAAATLTRREA